MKYIFLFFLLSSGLCYSQTHNVDPVTKMVTNFYAKYTFRNACSYDNDLNRQYNTITGEFIIIIKVGEDGSGTLITYIGEKKIWNILSCFKYDGYYEFELQKPYGGKFPGILRFNKYIDKFYITNPTDNTSVVLFN